MIRFLTIGILFLIAFLLTSCVELQMRDMQGKRDCLIKAIGFQDAYQNDHRFDPHRWSRILGIFWADDRKIGHAVCVYRFQNAIMVQDSGGRRGGWTLTRDLSLMDEPMGLARLYAPGTGITDAYYFEDLTK